MSITIIPVSTFRIVAMLMYYSTKLLYRTEKENEHIKQFLCPTACLSNKRFTVEKISP